MLGIFVGYPWLALVPAVLFGVLAVRTRRRRLWIASIMWLLYAAYEAGMQRRILCSGECNIRIDLLIVSPVLLVLSIAALVAAFTARRSRSSLPPG